MAKQVPAGTCALRLGEICQIVGGTLHGDADLVVERLTDLTEAAEDGLAFIEKAAGLDSLRQAPRALLVPPGIEPAGIPYITVERPRQAFLLLLGQVNHPWPLAPGISPLASVSEDAIVDPSASIGPFATVGPESVIGAGVKIYPHATIGAFCVVGKNVVIGSHATLVDQVSVGPDTIIHAGAVLGADGFGFFWNGKGHQKIPQVGSVAIGRDCEIGANTTIDRAMVGVTRLGNGVKVDNLVQIGHNCQIGDHVVIAACCAIGGSSQIGNGCVLGGCSIVSDHVILSDNVRIGGGTYVPTSLTESGDYFGIPAKPFGEGRRNFVGLGRMNEALIRIKELERKVEELEGK